MEKEQLQSMLASSKSKRELEKKIKKAGFRNTRFSRPVKGTDLQKIAKACDAECDEVDRGRYWLFASIGRCSGYEWIWLEKTRKQPIRYSVSIWAKRLPNAENGKI